MKKDKLEQYVIAHRAEFDLAEPPPHLWQRIEAGMDAHERAGRRVPLWRQLRAVAAAAALLLAGGLGGAQWMAHHMQQPEAIARAVVPDFDELTQYYTRTVQVRLARIDDPAVRREVERDLSQLDQVLGELKAALAEAPESEHEAIVQAMIANYQARLDILERVLERIQRKNHPTVKSQKDETKSI